LIAFNKFSMTHPRLDKAHRESLRSSARTLRGPDRRAFQASIALKYCGGNPARAEKLFGWGREAVALGLHEIRTGFVCYSARAAFSGNKLWEEKHPEIMSLLRQLVRGHDPLHPPSRKRIGHRWLTAKEAIQALREHGVGEEYLPSITTMTEILKRNGFRPASVRDDRSGDHDAQSLASLPPKVPALSFPAKDAVRSPAAPSAERRGYLHPPSWPEQAMAN
jgi:hypothetical protein